MEVPRGCLGHTWNLVAFFPFFILLLLLGIVKAILIAPIVLIVVTFGNSAVIIGLWSMHMLWTYYCIAKTKKFGIIMKGLLFLSLPIPLLLWPPFGFLGSFFAGLGFGLYRPLMATFEAVREGVPNKFVRCFMDGTWSTILGGCTIVRDFADVAFHSYFSFMDGLLESKTEVPTEIKISQIPGCTVAAVLGVLFDVPLITSIVIYKALIMLFKGWQRLVVDLIGRSGPFLETACVPFAGLSILLWPSVVTLAALAGISSSLFLGLYAAVIAYQENSTKSGILYIIAVVSLFDEYTNDFLYLREGSCFPRPSYRKGVSSSLPFLPVKRPAEKPDAVQAKKPPVKTPSMKMQELKAMVIWDNFFKACEYTGRELTNAGAIWLQDLEAWQNSKNNIVNIGIPAYTFLLCFLRSIKSGSSGFLMRDNVELTNVNRPEGRVFDWLFDPMSIMKEQIKSLHLQELEELYLFKLCLYCGNTDRVEAWNNGGIPPDNEIRRAQLISISRRLHGFCSSLSRLPTFRRRYHEVVKALIQEAKQKQNANGSNENTEATV